ncbi:hypothetical protein EG329_000864 [Mollisiaceae sp. DMI_Dod_QoI]|nr:hypothetical protein EG329_000864 [Helotiales sp. DMI_Dod_QoI]
MAANEYYQGQQPQHSYQQPINLQPQGTGISQTSAPSWSPEPPKSPWERPQHFHQAPEPAYQQQPQDQPKYYPNQSQQGAYYGPQHGQGMPMQSHVVVVQKNSSSKEDAALGCCAGCLAGCCCCGCTVM